jgi:HD superfamily phosphohydrolase
MGLSYLVYPGAHHTRFQHALGSVHLMQKAVNSLRSKGIVISNDEADALYAAILLHDIGHGPFSHAMENSIVNDISHEKISILFLEQLNDELRGSLDLTLKIFKNQYHRRFFFQLVSGQLDMDRLDYLKRDSFYTGVSEGSVNSQRLISMLNVVDDKLVVEEKGIYSVEKFLIARRFMYWQVYLHKTGLVAEQMLLRILRRAKELTIGGTDLFSSNALSFFLKNSISENDFDKEILNTFSQLDDSDIICAMKVWINHDDFVLSNLSRMILDRDLLKIKIKSNPFKKDDILRIIEGFMSSNGISQHEASYFVFTGTIVNQAYSSEKETISLTSNSGILVDVAEASDHLNLKALSKEVVKNYMCYPKSY